MGVTDADVAALIAIARDAARSAVLPRFRMLDGGEVATKSAADDLVTVADREAEALMTAAVRARWPDAVVIGEEAVSEGRTGKAAVATAELCVILDPIDGTWNFAHGLATFGMILAVVSRGRTLAGVLYDPLGDDAVTARLGAGAWFTRGETRRRVATQAPRALTETRGYSSHEMFVAASRRALAQPLTGVRRAAQLGCSCHEYRTLAQGGVGFVLCGGLEPWDHAAGALITREAGGVARLASGADYAPTDAEGVLLNAASEAAWTAVSQQLGPALPAARRG